MTLGPISLRAVFLPNHQPKRAASRAHALAGGLTVVALSAGMLSCSDAVEPDSLGNFSLTIAGKPNDAPAKSTCKANQLVAGAGTPRPSESAPGGRVTLDNACQVRKTGDVFFVQGTVKLGATVFFVRSEDVDPITRTGSARVTVDSGGQHYETCFDSGSCPAVADPMLCSIEVIQTNTPEGPETQVKAGAIWAKLSCPILHSNQVNDYCKAAGVFVLENCSK